MLVPLIIVAILLLVVILYTGMTVTKLKEKTLEKGLVDKTSVEPKPLFCYDCKHCIKKVIGDQDYSKCALTKQASTKRKDYLVTGEDISSGEFVYNICTYMRKEPVWQTIKCGPSAMMFEPKKI